MTITKNKKSKKYTMSHDVFFKRCIANPTIAREFFESYLPKDVLNAVELSTLRVEKSDFADKTLGKGVSDVLFSVSWNEQKGYLGLLVEHQSTSDKLMSMRIMKYILKICDLHVTQNHKNPLPLPPILPLVVYTGKTAYTAARSFFDLFPDPKQAKVFCVDSISVLSLRDIEDIDLRNRYHIGVILNLMQKIHKEDIYPDLQAMAPFLQLLATLNLHIAEDVLVYLLDSGKSKNKEKVLQLITEIVPEEHRGHMKTIGDQIRAEGELIGIEKGIEKGMEKERTAIVEKMLKKHMDVSEISSITELSVAEIERLKKKLH